MKPPERTPENGFALSPPFTSPASSSYPSPASSTCPSPIRSSYGGTGGSSGVDGFYPLPWPNGSCSSKLLSYAGSYSAPVTPPLTSPTCQSPRAQESMPKCSEWKSHGVKLESVKESAPADCAATALLNAWSNNTAQFYTSMVASCPTSPLLRSVAMQEHKMPIDADSMDGVKALYRGAAASSACSPSGLASPTPMGTWVGPWVAVSGCGNGGLNSADRSHISMWRPGASYVSPSASVCTGGGAGEIYQEGGQRDVASPPFTVKAWAGEQIHEECPVVAPDLELKL
ncbi:hypothetical protein KP509_09G031500 [Ceratopteris richardii]|nr:hypothetical protein KP509_09G031500 [Ceratopteris richardii]